MHGSALPPHRRILLAGLLLIGCGDGLNESPPGPDQQIVELKAGVFQTCALARSGTLRCWGRHFPSDIYTGDLFDSLPQPFPGNLTITDFSIANGDFGGAICAVTTGQATYCFGQYAEWEHYIS